MSTSRRQFIQSSGAAALVLGFAWPAGNGRALAADLTPVFSPNAYLRITPDNRVTVVCGSAEMGQGVLTAIPMLLAEELDADWSLVSVIQAPADKAYNNPMFGMQATGGSTTVRAHWGPLRKAGAAAREMLVSAAAQRWKLDPAALSTANSRVISPDGRTLTYGALVAAAAAQSVPTDPKLKDAKNFKLLGQPLKRLDTPGKVNGTAKFGLDAHVPNLLVAVMARAPLPGAKPTSMTEAAAKAVKGVHQVITLATGVAVLADGYWAAKKGRDALNVQWDLGDYADLSSEKISALFTEGADTASAAVSYTHLTLPTILRV